MCISCWEEAGRPAIANDRVRAAADLVPDCPPGRAYTVFENWNLGDRVIHEALKDPEAVADEEARAALTAFAALSLEERHSAMALADGMFDPGA